jgi:hypothetical protein
MQERVKVFTFVSGHGQTVVEPPHEDHINQWLSTVKGRLVQVSQSESERAAPGHHITVCVWYVPDESTISHAQAGAAGRTGPSEGHDPQGS